MKDELKGELELTAEKIKTTFDKRKKVGENLQELENYFKDLGFQLNCTLANESDYSNEITDTLDTTPPAPPQNLSIWQKIIAWLKTIFNWG